MIEEYRSAGIKPKRVWAQSFSLEDVEYWIAAEPSFGKQAVFLEDRFYEDGTTEDSNDASTWSITMDDLIAKGVNIVAPPMWNLVTLNDADEIVPSEYAIEAKAAGLEIITWTLERSGLLLDGGGWYYQVRLTLYIEIGRSSIIYMAIRRGGWWRGIRDGYRSWSVTLIHFFSWVICIRSSFDLLSR